MTTVAQRHDGSPAKRPGFFVCANRGCDDPAVATVDDAPRCFTHEREAIDRYGVGALRVRPISSWAGTIEEAVAGLRG